MDSPVDKYQVLKDKFGFSRFRSLQGEVIDEVLKGRDCLVVMPTGMGKSLCYQLPSLILEGIVLVVSPLIALMKDQVDSLREKGIPSTFINSSIDSREQMERIELMAGNEFSLVYVAPERFRSRSFMQSLEKIGVSLLAVDEAHCISQWGHDFRPDYIRLSSVREFLKNPPTIALTATATQKTRDDIKEQLHLSNPKCFLGGFDRENLFFSVLETPTDTDKRQDIKNLVKEHGVPAIIYCGTRNQTDDVAQFLMENSSLRVANYHAGLDDDTRKGIQDSFMGGRLDVIIATNAFGMGVDKEDVRAIIHYNITRSMEAYYQEVGRAGRDGLPSQCILLFNPADRYLQEYFIEGDNPSREIIEEVYRILKEKVGEFKYVSYNEFIGTTFMKISQMAYYSSLKILERFGCIERSSRPENMATILLKMEPEEALKKVTDKARNRKEVLRILLEDYGIELREKMEVSLDGLCLRSRLEIGQVKRALKYIKELQILDYIPPSRGRGIRVVEMGKEDTGVDYSILLKKKNQDKKKLDNMMRYAKNSSCRRDFILSHFGETPLQKNCQGCDNCVSMRNHRALGPIADDEIVVIQKILSCVARMREGYSMEMIIKVLRGSRAQEVKSFGFDRLSTYGIVKEFDKATLKRIINELVVVGCIEKKETSMIVRGYPRNFFTLGLTELGWQVMQSKVRDVRIDFPRDILREKEKDTTPPSKTLSRTSLETFKLYQEGCRALAGHTLADIAETRGFAISTIVEHMISLMERNYPIDIDKLVSSEKIGGISEAVKRTGTLRLKPIKESLPQDYTYEEIKLVVASLRSVKDGQLI